MELKIYVWNPIEIKERERSFNSVRYFICNNNNKLTLYAFILKKIHQPMHKANAHCAHLVWLWASLANHILGQSDFLYVWVGVVNHIYKLYTNFELRFNLLHLWTHRKKFKLNFYISQCEFSFLYIYFQRSAYKG